MGIEKFNRSKTTWTIDTEGFKFVKLKDLKEGEHYPLRGMFISSDNGYGEGAVLITDTCYVNIPASNVDLVKKILDDPESIEQMNTEHAEFSYSVFRSEKYHRDGYSLEFYTV